METQLKEKIKTLPQTPGVYIFKNKLGKIVYIGKAGNIKRRAASYFSSKEKRATVIAEKAFDIEFEETETVIEALVREAVLIKKHRPPLNIKDNDDRSFLYMIISNDDYPQVSLVRERDVKKENLRSIFGPFVFASEIKEAMKIIRKIFPYSTHTKKEIEKGVSCFYYQIGLCPGTCSGKIDKTDYLKNIKNIEYFFQGKKKQIVKSLQREMKKESKNLHYEKAKEIKRKIDALQFIQETALLKKRDTSFDKEGVRIEAYDISNISGSFAVGSMIVFEKGVPQKKEYRLFKIKEGSGPDDTGMIQEVIRRRFNHKWEKPELILIDGGRGQVSAVKKILLEKNLNIPVVGIAKGRDRKGEFLVGVLPKGINKEILLEMQKEAHRFAINYHRKLRKEGFLDKN